MSIEVKKHSLGYGITDGEKWFYYAYENREKALEVMVRILLRGFIRVNISYPEPMELIPKCAQTHE